MTEQDYDFWVCDECRKTYRKDRKQYTVRVQQRTERIAGTSAVYRPIENLTICQGCYDRYREWARP